MPVSDSPGVHVPPPFLYVAAIAAGAVLRRYLPLAIGGGAPRLVAAWIFVALFAGVVGWSFLSFWLERTTVIPNRPAAALVTYGPYRYSRNPMYVGMALLTAGAGLWLNTWWVLVLLAAAIAGIDRFVIPREEAYLRRRFGAEYDGFTSRVRRWL